MTPAYEQNDAPDTRATAKPRVIYDTNIVLQATLNPDGPAEHALKVLDRGEVKAVMSNRLRSEYEAVLDLVSALPHEIVANRVELK